MSRVDKADSAFEHRDAAFTYVILGSWPDAADNAKHIDWARSVHQAIQPFAAGGVYVNYLQDEADEGRERIRAAYGPEKYARLVTLKKKYDPGNLFRLNQSIRP